MAERCIVMLGYNSGESYKGVLTLNSETNLIETYDNVIRSFMNDHGYRIVKKARRKGYIKRGSGVWLVANYNGRYGTGYSVFLPSYDSSRFVYVLYFIK